MTIDSITIQNFRNIGGPDSFLLDPNFSAIIGINGKGKSTILSALRIACGAYFLAVPDVKKWHIQPDEVRVKNVNGLLIEQKPVKIEAIGTFPGLSAPITWRRQILEDSNSTTSKDADVGNVRALGKSKFDEVINEERDNVGLPVIGFFGTSRAYGAGRNREGKARIGRQIFREGYNNWFEMKSNTFKYESWLETYDVLLKNGQEYAQTKEAFFACIKIANPYITGIEFVGRKLWLKIDMEGIVSDLLPIELHSDGIRFYTEMVAEIAYRCIVLNGYLGINAITKTKGVVMIDELDLHLHPNWQRRVVSDLKSAFENIQFVVTTHSPFIVQSLKRKELINLSESTLDSDPSDYGIEDVSEGEMDVKGVERSEDFIEREKTAEEYYKLIAEGKTSETDNKVAELRQKLNELEQRFSNDPKFVALLKAERDLHSL